MRSFRLASGDEAVHLKQAARLEKRIDERGEGVAIVAVPVPSEEHPGGLLGALGDAVLGGSADAALCPAGLMSAGLPPGLEVGAVFKDCDPAYRWISCGRPGPAGLPHGTGVVTWDDVSRAQLLFRYPGLVVTSARGWTKVFEGLRRGTWGAACLPPEVVEAGSLWGLDCVAVAPDEVMPAIGQGAAAILVPMGSSPPLVSSLDEREVSKRLRLESITWWNAMHVPSTVVTAHATLQRGNARVEGLVVEADGMWLIADSGEAEEPYGDFVARDVAQSCLEAAWSRWNRRAVAHGVTGRAAS